MTQRQVLKIRKVQRTFETPVYCDTATGQVVISPVVYPYLASICKAEILKNFLVRRARVRDDPGRSPPIELEPERSFVGPLSGQSVYEQTSGVLRHTESVQDDKVQKQDWKQSLEKKFCVPPARPRSCSHRRRQQGPSEVRIAAKAEQLNQNNDPEGREVVQVFNSRLSTGEAVSQPPATGAWKAR